MIYASISTSDDIPTRVQVAHRGNAVDLDPEHPARSVELALNAIGYEIAGPFVKVSDHLSRVSVREAPGSFLTYLAGLPGKIRVGRLGGYPRVFADTRLMLGVYPAMTLAEVDEYDAGEREVRIR